MTPAAMMRKVRSLPAAGCVTFLLLDSRQFFDEENSRSFKSMRALIERDMDGEVYNVSLQRNTPLGWKEFPIHGETQRYDQMEMMSAEATAQALAFFLLVCEEERTLVEDWADEMRQQDAMMKTKATDKRTQGEDAG